MDGALYSTATENRSRCGSAEEALLERWEPLARRLAYHFVGAADREDLEQVARLALIQAARRFDPSRRDQFSTYVASVILGHLRHYLRDQEPMIRVPRRWWELHLPVKRLSERLAQAFGREPTVAELAARLGVSEEDVAGALRASELFQLESLDKPRVTPEDGVAELLSDRIGGGDPRLEAVELRVAFQQVMERLPARLREVLERRYFQKRSQHEVARDLGFSQMHISRLERRALAQLREALRDGWGPEPEAAAAAPAATDPTRQRWPGCSPPPVDATCGPARHRLALLSAVRDGSPSFARTKSGHSADAIGPALSYDALDAKGGDDDCL